MLNLSTIMIFLCFLTTACGGSDSSETSSSSLQNTNLKGIYTISSYTKNSDNCTTEGNSILTENSPSLTFLEAFSAFGIQYLQVISCESVEECKTVATKLKNGETAGITLIYSFTFEAGNDSVGYSGISVSTGFSRNDQCEDAKSSELKLNSDDESASITIRKESKISESYPLDSDGFCTSDGAKAATEGLECSELEVFKATFKEAL
ncbi:MAG: hypothetical protein AB8G05_20010 [Oligoflexales bacterium]